MSISQNYIGTVQISCCISQSFQTLASWVALCIMKYDTAVCLVLWSNVHLCSFPLP